MKYDNLTLINMDQLREITPNYPVSGPWFRVARSKTKIGEDYYEIIRNKETNDFKFLKLC